MTILKNDIVFKFSLFPNIYDAHGLDNIREIQI